MRFFTAVTAFLAAGFAASSPIATGQDVNVAERAEVTSLSDFSSQVESLKGVVVKDFSSSENPSASELSDLTDRINRLIQGLVPLNLDIVTGGDLLNLLGVLGHLGDIVRSLTKNLPLGGGLKTRNLSYAPVLKEVRVLITALSKLVSEVLTTVYRAIGSDAANADPELKQKLLSGTSGLSSGVGGLFSILGGLLAIGN